MYDDRYGINSRVTVLTGIYGYLVDGPRDRACEPSDNSTDLEGNHVSGLAQHRDSHLQIYSPTDWAEPVFLFWANVSMTATCFCPVAIWTIKDTESFHG